MLRLVFADLLANARVWTGLVVVAVLSSLLGGLTAGFIESGVRQGGVTALATFAISGVVILFATIAAVVVMSSVASLTVSLQQRAYALWQVVGISPALVRFVVLAQVAVTSTAGASVGAVAAPPLLPGVLDFVLDGATGFEDLQAAASFAGAAAAAVLVVLVAVSASATAARSASRVSVIAAVRSTEQPAPPMGAGGLVRGGLLVLASLGLVLSQRGRPPATAELPLLMAGVLLAAGVAAVGPALFPGVTAAWTRVVPGRVSSAWFLARATATDNVRRGAATVGPLMLAVALAGSLFSVDATVVSAGGGSGEQGLPPQVVVLLVGGPIALAVVGATATVFMAGRARAAEFGLLRAAGATPGMIVAAAVCEALIYTGTAFLVALLVTFVTATGAALAVQETAAGALPSLHLGEALVVAAASLILMLCATVIPTLTDLRRSPRATLAATT
ncbi:FtsX-like permease family protein [Microbacteriaceae bacterium 4G12]